MQCEADNNIRRRSAVATTRTPNRVKIEPLRRLTALTGAVGDDRLCGVSDAPIFARFDDGEFDESCTESFRDNNKY